MSLAFNSFEPNNNFFNVRKIQESYLLSSKAIIYLEPFNGKMRYSTESTDGWVISASMNENISRQKCRSHT